MFKILSIITISLSLASCMASNVNNVKISEESDHFNKSYKRSTDFQRVEDLNETDRLVLVSFKYKNPLEFGNVIRVYQNNAERAYTDKRITDVYLVEKSDDYMLLLFSFSQGGENTAVIQPAGCNQKFTTFCFSGLSGAGGYFNVNLPADGEVTYAGTLAYSIVDQFPDRGTQNYPLIKKINVKNNFNKDMKTAVNYWPVLKNKKIRVKLASISKGNAPLSKTIMSQK